MASSAVGTWSLRTRWRRGFGANQVFNAADMTFHADGSWASPGSNNFGAWVQSGDLVMWHLTGGALVYSGAIRYGITEVDVSMTGLMVHWYEGGNRGTFSAQRLGAFDDVVVANAGVSEGSDPPPDPSFDPVLGPAAEPDTGFTNGSVATGPERGANTPPA